VISVVNTLDKAAMHKPLSVAVVAILLFAAHAQAQAAVDACLAPAPRTFRALNERVTQLERSRVSADQSCELAALYARDGRLEDAETMLGLVLREQPDRTGAQVLLMRVMQNSGRADEATRLIERTPAIAATPQARLFLAARAPVPQRVAILESIAADNPASADALVALAGEYVRLQRDTDARQLLDRALLLDTANAAAMVQYAQLQLRAGSAVLRRAWLDRALAADSLSIQARNVLSSVLRAEGDRDGAFRVSVVNARLDPYFFGHGGLAQGGSRISWPKYPPFADDSVPPGLAMALAAADTLLTRKELDRADAAFRNILAQYPGLAAARVGIGAVSYYRRDYQESARVFRSLAHDHPGFGLAHYGVSQSEKMQADAGNDSLKASVQRFRDAPVPPEPLNLRDVFPDYDRLNDDYRKIVLLSVAPMRNFIPVLAAGGATFQLIPFHKRMWELPNKQRTRGKYTFDLRLWDDVKGQGGFHSLGGEEWMGDVLYERFNVFAHEFFHQVHSMFTDEQKLQVTELFRLAKREKRTLDSYADFNEMEYLAQVYEAWISEHKTTRGGTGGHTREEVLAKDPAAARFLESMVALPSYRENEIIAVRGGIQNQLNEGRLDSALVRATAALRKYGDHPLLLASMGTVLRYRGEYAGALEIDTRALQQFPDRITASEQLASDYTLGRHDYGAAADVFMRFTARDSAKEQGWLNLADSYIAALRLDEASRALDRAGAIIGEPNPVARYHAMRASVSMLRGDLASARKSYEHILNTIARDNVQALTDLALMSARAGDLPAARIHLGTALTVSPDSPIVLETEARVLAAEGRKEAAVAALTSMLKDDPYRLETYTALISLMSPADAARAGPWITAGRQLIQRKEPVRFIYRKEQWQQQGRISPRSIADFETAAKRFPSIT
jgi:tetratricopeptide (TPR) repeat protein